MKLKNYLSTKRLRRKMSKVTTKESHCNDSFTDYNDEEHPVSKDDLYLEHKGDGILRLKRQGGSVGVRSDMTQSLIGRLPSTYQHQQTEAAYVRSSDKRDHSSQTIVDNLTSYNTCHPDINHNSHLTTYKDNLQGIELVSDNPLYATRGVNHSVPCHATNWDWQFQSLPSSQTQSHYIIKDIHYNSLPSSMTQSVHMDSSLTAVKPPCDKWKRSRIKTNPWLPLPQSNTETLRRNSSSSKRKEPRLSRFFSEVEQIMREQCAIAAQTAADASDSSSINGSKESLASTCSTATEIPERQADDVSPMRSPSEGYKSAYSGSACSDLNMADTESLNESFSDSLSSSISDLTKNLDIDSTKSLSFSHCPPSLQDFNASLKLDHCRSNNNDSLVLTSSSTNSLMSESMFASTSSVLLKCEALQNRVRKLCQSTTNLDEKMRLARIESQYIKVK